MTAEERKARGLIEKLSPFLAQAVLTLEQQKRTHEDHVEKAGGCLYLKEETV